jgi:hypothetical protein
MNYSYLDYSVTEFFIEMCCNEVDILTLAEFRE